MRRNLGVPKGYRHIWTYSKGKWDETKVKKGLWKFSYKVLKSHKGSRSEGNFGVGSTGAWKIKGIQCVKKVSPNAYKTILVGTKRPLKFKVKLPKRKRFGMFSKRTKPRK